MTSSPPIQMKSAIPIGAKIAIAIHFFFLFMLCSLTIRIISSLHFVASFLRKFVVNALQSFAQMKYRVTLAREQGVDADAGFRRELFEASPLEFVSDEHVTLLIGKFAESKFQLIQKYAAEVERFRPGIWRWQQIFDPQKLAGFVLERCAAEGHRLFLAEKVGDAITRDAKKPAGDVLDRHQQAIGFHQFVEDFLHDVLGVGGIGHTAADEVA